MLADPNGNDLSLLICLDFIFDLYKPITDPKFEGLIYGTVSHWMVWFEQPLMANVVGKNSLGGHCITGFGFFYYCVDDEIQFCNLHIEWFSFDLTENHVAKIMEVQIDQSTL